MSVLDMFDEIECLFERITSDKNLLSDLLKLPVSKIEDIYDQNTGVFTAVELAQILRRSEAVLKEKREGRIRVPVSHTQFVPKTPVGKTESYPVFPEFKTKDSFLQKDKDPQIPYEEIVFFLYKELKPYKDLNVETLGTFLGIKPNIISGARKQKINSTYTDALLALQKIKMVKKLGFLKTFAFKERQKQKELKQIRIRGEVVRNIFKSYYIPNQVLCEFVRMDKASIEALLNEQYEKLTLRMIDRMERFAKNNPSRSSLYKEDVKFEDDHSDSFIKLYQQVREKTKRLNVPEVVIAIETEIPRSIFNSLREGKFNYVTANTLQSLEKYLVDNPEFISV